MTPNLPVASVPPEIQSSQPAPSPAKPPPGKKRPWILYGCGSFFALLLLIVLTVVITLWWIQRPIKPVVLSQKEKAKVEEKLQRLGGGRSPGLNGERGAQVEVAPLQPEHTYKPGDKMLKLTEREINGLLHQNTDLGESVRIQFDRDAVNAYIAVPIPQDFPILGGKMFRARANFGLSIGNGGTPYASLQDLTVFGLSLPKAWLGGIKGQNLLENAVGTRNGSPILQGIKSLRVEPGALVLEVNE
jgi:hypothetical protein